MPYGLKRYQQSAQSHFVTFTCYHRRRGFHSPAVYDLFLQVLEEMRCRFALRVYGYVVMPEHVHLLMSEPQRGLLADAMHYLKLSFAKRLVAQVRAQLLGANLGHLAAAANIFVLLPLCSISNRVTPAGKLASGVGRSAGRFKFISIWRMLSAARLS